MLSAQKALLQATVQEGGAQLQAQELSYLGSNFSTISTMASIIAGFSFSGLLLSTSFSGRELHRTRWGHQVITNLYYFCTATAIGSCLLACVVATVIGVRGTGLALRGPDGSLKIAVETMRFWQRVALWTLSVGVVSFHMQGMSYAWLELTLITNVVIVTTVLGVVLIIMVLFIFAIYATLTELDFELNSGELSDAQLAEVLRRLRGGQAGQPTQTYGATDHIETGILEPPPGKLPDRSTFASMFSSVIDYASPAHQAEKEDSKHQGPPGLEDEDEENSKL